MEEPRPSIRAFELVDLACFSCHTDRHTVTLKEISLGESLYNLDFADTMTRNKDNSSTHLSSGSS